MLKKTFLISSVLFGFAFFTIENCLAETADELETQKQLVISYITDGQQQQAETAIQELLDNFGQNENIPRAVHHVAYRYRQLQNCEEANRLDQHVIDNWPRDEHAMWAQVDIAKSSLDRSDEAQAQAGIDKVLTYFSKHNNIDLAVHNIAFHYRQLQNCEKANQLDRYVLDRWPETEGAMWSQVDLLKSSIDNGKFVEAQSGIDKLLANYSDKKYVAKAVHDIAFYYRQIQKHEKANRLDRHVVDTWPVTESAMWAHVDLIRSNIDNGNLIAAQADADKLIADYSDKENISTVVHDIAYYCRQSQKHEMANRIDRCVLDRWPETESAMWAQIDLLKSSIDNGKFVEAQSGIDKLLANYSDKKYVAKAVHDIAFYYRQIQKHEKANRLDRHVVDTWPVTESAMWAHVDLIRSNIDNGNLIAAQADVDKLIADYSDKENISTAVHGLAYYCREKQKPAKADELDRYVLDHWPDSESAMWSQIDLVKSNIDSGKFDESQLGFDKLIADFNDDTNMADAAHSIVSHYRWASHNEKADQICQYVIKTWPNRKCAKLLEMDMVVANIDIEDYNDVQSGLDTLITDFNDCPQFLPVSISNIEKRYYKKTWNTKERSLDESYHRKPVEVWENVMTRLPDFFHDEPDLYYFIACCYYQLGEYEKAINHYYEVIDSWPGYKYVEESQQLMDKCFEKLED